MNRPPSTRRNPEFYHYIPKVDLHRHLEGSLRFSTIVEIARLHGLTIPTTGHLRTLVQVGEEEPYTFRNFLSKFEVLRQLYRSPDIISRITREAIADAVSDHVRYLELRFTPMALAKSQNFSLDEVMDWVIQAAEQEQAASGITVRLIASVNRNEAVKIGEEVAQLAVDRIGRGIVGLDLAGNEAEYSALPFAGLLREAQQAGLHLTVHAGEWAGPQNVADAIQYLNAERIGHGVRVVEDPAAMELAAERQTAFEVCITSNYQSGVVGALIEHPLPRMLAAGLNATINTDDPSISQIRLSDEYRIATEDLGLSLELIEACTLAAARATFLRPAERETLEQSLHQEFRKLGF